MNGSVISIEKVSGRQETWGQTSAPAATPERWMSTIFKWAPPPKVNSAV